MDEEIKKLIEDYVKQVENKETDLVFLQREIDKTVFDAERKMKSVQSDLNSKFDANTISEEEYLKLFREAKENILQKTKVELDGLLKGLEE